MGVAEDKLEAVGRREGFKLMEGSFDCNFGLDGAKLESKVGS